MNDYYTTTMDSKVSAVCKAAFPAYKGIKCRVTFTENPVNMADYWDGGSRSSFAIVRLGDNAKMDIPTQSPYDPKLHGVENFAIPPGFVVVEHVIFCGKDMGLVIHARPDGSNLLPESNEQLSDLEAHVLIATAAYKSSYGPYSDNRAYELNRKYGYKMAQINEARQSLQAKGMMAANKSITNKGRNAIAAHPDRYH